MIAGQCAANAAPRAKIEAVHRTVLSSELAGPIDKISIKEGESFDKGDVLVSLDCRSYRAQRDRVAAKLASAKRKRQNKQQLERLHSAGKLEVELARLNVKQTAAKLRGARVNVSRCDVKAPFTGRVVKLFASLGQSVKAQQKLAKIVGRRLNARVVVPANWLSWLDKGTNVKLDVSETGKRLSGRIVRIGAAVDPVSHTVGVWAKLTPSSSLRPGMTATAHFPGAPEKTAADGN